MSNSERWRMGAVAVTGVLALGLVLLLMGAWPTTGSAGQSARVERGRYLVTIAACNDCHTPWVMTPEGPAPDMKRMLSGHPADLAVAPPPSPTGPWAWGGTETNTAFHGPWGVSFAMNLTPDEDTGIGAWTEEIFVSAIRTGRHWGASRPILPPMPWSMYAHMTDADLAAIFAYLRTIPPVSNRVPEPIPPA